MSEPSVPYAMLTSNRQPHDDLVSLSGLDDVADLQNFIKKLKLTTLKASRYCLRHGGTSEDLRSGRRSALDVMRRGRLRSDSSLRHYGKDTKLLAEMRKIDPLMIDYS